MKYPMITYEITYELSFVTDRYVSILNGIKLIWIDSAIYYFSMNSPIVPF